MYNEIQLLEDYHGFKIRSHGVGETKRIVCVSCSEGDYRTFSKLLLAAQVEFDRLVTLGIIRFEYVTEGPCTVDREMVVAAAGPGYVFQGHAVDTFRRSIDYLWGN